MYTHKLIFWGIIAILFVGVIIYALSTNNGSIAIKLIEMGTTGVAGFFIGLGSAKYKQLSNSQDNSEKQQYKN